MLSVGCIQAQKCHTGYCPTGVATQRARLVRGLDPTDKSVRTAGYLRSFRRDLRALCHAMGVEHPSLIRLDQIAIRSTDGHLIDAAEAFGLNADWFDDDRRSRLRGVLVG